MGGDKLFDMMNRVTKGTYVNESANEWNSIELELVALKQRLMDKIDKADPKYDEVFNAFESLLASVTTANRSQEEAPVAEAAADTDAQIPNPDNPEAAKPMEDGAGQGSDMTLESVLLEKDDKKEEWADGRSHEEAVKQIVKDSMKELVTDLKFRYTNRIVIFDMQSTYAGADTLSFAPLVDNILMVVQEGNASAKDIKRAISLLPEGKLLGLMLNRHNAASHVVKTSSPRRNNRPV